MTVGELRKALEAYPDDMGCWLLENDKDARGYDLYKKVICIWETELVTFTHSLSPATRDTARKHTSIIIG